MREIVHVQLGTCGNAIGTKFWETILREHRLDCRGEYYGNSPDFHLQSINVYFKQLEIRCPIQDKAIPKVRYVPRAILVDLDPRLRQTISQCCREMLIDNDNVVCGSYSAGGNWAKGYYDAGPGIVNSIMDLVRKDAEACDSMQGIQVMHGLGGGTGGGLGSLLAQHMLEQYPDKILKFYSMIPSRVSISVPDVYNTVLALQYLDNYVHEIFCIDYDAVERIRKEDQGRTSKCDWISNCLSGITTCLRFPCQLNTSLRKFLVNMVPHPRLHFFVPGYVETELKQSSAAVLSMAQRMFDNKNILVNCNLAEERFFTVAAMFRGRISPKDVGEQMLQIREKYKNNFVDWIPHSTKTAICDIMPCCQTWSVTSLLNTSAIQQPFQALLDCFQHRVSQKWHLHWYTNEGMDKSEFIDAQNNLHSILSYYKEQNLDTPVTSRELKIKKE